MFRSPLCGLLLGLLFGNGRHGRRRFDCFALLVLPALVIDAGHHSSSNALAKNDDGGLGLRGMRSLSD